MQRLYLLGGENLETRSSRPIDQSAFQAAGGSPMVAVFPWTSDRDVLEDKYRRQMVDYFKEMGARAVRFIEHSLPYAEMARLVEDAQVVYLPGGRTELLLERLRRTGAEHLLRLHDGVIIGNSAGALALANEHVTGLRGGGLGGPMISRGLGLVDFTLSVHYDLDQDAALEALSLNRRIFAIPENSALVVGECSLDIMGDVAIFQDGKKI